MSETKQLDGPTVNPGKLAMSRALGAAFLNHQVEQLEKSVTSVSISNGNGPASGNWRNRRPNPNPMPPNVRHPPMAAGIKVASRRTGEDSQAARKGRGPAAREVSSVGGQDQTNGSRRKSSDEEKEDRGKGKDKDKDADVVIIDASVLVHALYQLKKWCRDGRGEVVIVPLEALNTLDLLKKGTSPLAQRARAASRILEAQVGTNPRIRVQQDDAFVLWDKIAFEDVPEMSSDTENPKSATPAGNAASPEWVRRTICCARWEVENAKNNMATPTGSSPSASPRVLLAVLGSAPSTYAVSDASPGSATLKLLPDSNSLTAPETLTPVPLPAPSLPHPNKYEPRSAGVLVAYWAKRAGVRLVEVEATRSGSDEEFGKRPHASSGRNRRTSGNTDLASHGSGGPGYGGSSPYGTGIGGHSAAGKGALVERPPAVMAMMEMVAQPHRKVVRVLARGEKLDPDP